jgi:hypothetical protein
MNGQNAHATKSLAQRPIARPIDLKKPEIPSSIAHSLCRQKRVFYLPSDMHPTAKRQYHADIIVSSMNVTTVTF